MLPFFLLFIGLPIVELMLLVRVGGELGWAPTVLIVLLTGVVGASLARQQGLSVLARMKREMNAGGVPAGAMLEGALVLAAGLTLLTPGFLTDAFGLACLFPPTRRAILGAVKRWFDKAQREGRVVVGGSMPLGGTFRSGPVPASEHDPLGGGTEGVPIPGVRPRAGGIKDARVIRQRDGDGEPLDDGASGE